ncbi:MAG: hypothetical protein WAW80_00835 [Candidatus Saccharimonadales bacterium]
MNMLRLRQRGSVSLFIVIFAALLIITISTAFIRIMIQDQSQATANDLSKSALDSANAGVEDAKRVIVEYYRQNCPSIPVGNSDRCDSLRNVLIVNTTPPNDGWTNGCQATVDAGVASLTNGEVLVKTANADDEQLDQAYTCLKVQMNPTDYIGALKPNVSRLIPLKSRDGVVFTQIRLQWYSQQNQTINLDQGDIPYVLPDKWPVNRPAVMRAQLLQYKSDFQLSEFDNDSNYNASLFFLPSIAGVSDSVKAYFSSDKRQSRSSGSAQSVACHQTSTASRYACEVTIVLPDWGDPASITNRNAYLKLSQFYSTINTDFRITMLTDGGEIVRFTDVQPVVDSTGRANDIFRRIQSRIDIGTSSIPNAEAAVDVTKSLCKEFIVTRDNAYPGDNVACPRPPVNP